MCLAQKAEKVSVDYCKAAGGIFDYSFDATRDFYIIAK
jgi:hypothetical protein